MWESDSEPEEEVNMAFVGAEALADKRRKENEKLAGLEPRLRVQERIEHSSSSEGVQTSRKNIPPLPPKSKMGQKPSMNEYDDESVWYHIQSPREEHGAVGPHSVKDLSFMYKTRKISDSTLLWREGNIEWMPLQDLHYIRATVQGMPTIPPRNDQSGKNDVFKKDLMKSDARTKVEKLSIYRTELWCGVCQGNLASCHMPGAAEQKPDLSLLRQPVGNTENVREIMAGFLFVGNKDTAKLSTIVPMGISLVIGTAEKLKNPAARPPHFRCQIIKLKDRAKFDSMPDAKQADEESRKAEEHKDVDSSDQGPDKDQDQDQDDDKEDDSGEFEAHDAPDNNVDNSDSALGHRLADVSEAERYDEMGKLKPAYDYELQKYLKMLERAADWIETERINPLLSEKGDPLPVEYRGPVDRYGRPKRDDENAVKTKTASQRAKEGLEKRNPSRVLLWSKRGDNRACTVAAAYLIKRFGMTVSGALEVVGKNIPNMSVTRGNMWALEELSKRHSLGLLLCDDCVVNAVDDEHESRISEARKILESHGGIEDSSLHTSGSTSVTVSRSESALEQEQGNKDPSELLVMRGPLGLPYVPSKEEKDKELERQRAILHEQQLKKAKTLDSKIAQSSAASRRLRRRRRRSRYPNEVYDDLEARAAGSKVLVELCSEGIFDILPLNTVPEVIKNHSCYKMLCDLELSGRNLTDSRFVAIIKELVALDVAKQLRLVNLSNNSLGDDSIRLLCSALWSEYEEVCFGPCHHVDGDSSAIYPVTEVALLFLQNNKIGEKGATYLANFLKFTSSVVTLDISNNSVGDHGCHNLLHALVRPGLEFDGDSDEDDDMIANAISRSGPNSADISRSVSATEDINTGHSKSKSVSFNTSRPYNRSVMDFRATNIDVFKGAADTLANMISRSQTLFALNIDANPDMGPRGLKNVLRAVKLANKTLCQLSMNDVPLLLAHFELLFGALEEGLCPLAKLSMARCNVTNFHMAKIDGRLGASKSLTHLDMSGNPFGDKGACALAEELYASTGHSHEHHSHGHAHHEHAAGALVSAHYIDDAKDEESEENNRRLKPKLPLESLELCSCGFKEEGLSMLLSALRSKPSLTTLDLSENDFSDTKASAVLAEGVRRLSLRSLRVNICNLGTIGARKLIRSFTPGAPVRVDVKKPTTRNCNNQEHGDKTVIPTYDQYMGPTVHSMPNRNTPVSGGDASPMKVNNLGLTDPFGTLDSYKGVSETPDSTDDGEKAACPTIPLSEQVESMKAIESIRVLSLSGNAIGNPVGMDLRWLLERNMHLSLLDLGFNKITDAIKEDVIPALTVQSSSDDSKKARDLHINMVGNLCDQSIFETPNLTRSKVTFAYALSSGNDLTHVPKAELPVFRARLQSSLLASRQDPVPTSNCIA